MGSAEAASTIKKLTPGTKIILFSMHVGNVLGSVAATIGVDLALPKSDRITQLGEHLKTLLAPGRPKSVLTVPTGSTSSLPNKGVCCRQQCHCESAGRGRSRRHQSRTA